MNFSPLSFCATLLLHVALFLGAMVSFHHRDSRATSKQYIRVVLPITAPTRPDVTLPDLSDNVITPGELTSTLDQDQPVDPDHYYLPAELSQQVAVVKSDAANEVIKSQIGHSLLSTTMTNLLGTSKIAGTNLVNYSAGNARTATT